jgi:hypothetical protein
MGRNYNRELRERGIILPGLGRGKGCRIWDLWRELNEKQRAAFCLKNGLMPPPPPEGIMVNGVGKDAPRLFGLLWRELTNKQKRAFCTRAGLMPIPAPPLEPAPLTERIRLLSSQLNQSERAEFMASIGSDSTANASDTGVE